MQLRPYPFVKPPDPFLLEHAQESMEHVVVNLHSANGFHLHLLACNLKIDILISIG